MAKAQLALQQLLVAVFPLLFAQLVITLGVFGVQQQLPEVRAHFLQLDRAITQGMAQVVVAEDDPLADHILYIKMVGHGAHHIGPETLALLQGQFDQLAAGNVADAQDHRVVILVIRRQAQHQP